MTVRAGESFVVHDPSPPTAVGVRFANVCPKGGLVEVLEGKRVVHSATGDARAQVWIQAGSHPYRVRCRANGGVESRTASRGYVTVKRDAGTAKLPGPPPPSEVATDGRNYTIIYQSAAPAITVTWPNAPKAPGYEVRLTSGAGDTRIIRTRSATHTFKPGDVPEGTHSLLFRVRSEGGSESRATTLKVKFDNVAPTALITSPSTGSFRPGDTVRVAGLAAEGWSVSVGGTALPLDRQRRFSATTIAPPGDGSIAIRLAHPRHGVHYYLRKGR